jgi:magnesium chelatase family protein
LPSLLGGGINPQPGEISLSHNGILFLDEFTEFKPATLEALRQPLENHIITIIRRGQSITYPANFLLIAAFNPCPCGYFGDTKRTCECSRFDVLRYMSKLSGPILDRIDLQLALRSVEYQDVHNREKGQSSADLAIAVNKAITIQLQRGIYNALLTPAQITQYCILTDDAKLHLEKAFIAFNLTMRSYHKLLRVSRTIADLEESPLIHSKHISEALTYRNLDQTIQKMVKT